jgi:RNA polymerase sigma-70 factor (ECF subfamily)
MDRDLVLRAQDGDHDAFAALAGASIGRLNAVARLVLRDAGQADEAVQEALVDAWRSLRGLRDPDRFQPWLHRLLVRACYNVANREKRRIHAQVRDTERAGVTSDSAAAVAQSDELERGLRRLQPEQRAALVIIYYLDLSFVEAAQVLGVPIGTLKSRVNRSLQALRAALAAEEREAARAQERYA